MKLKIELRLDLNRITGRVLEQDEELRSVRQDILLIKNDMFEIVSSSSPNLRGDRLYVRGDELSDDNISFGKTFATKCCAEERYKTIIHLVNELNGEIGGVIDEWGKTLYIDDNGEVLARANETTTNQSAKADKGKLELSLVNPELVKAVAEVRMYGTEKYGDSENWRKVEPKRYVDALYRHLLAYIGGSEVDEESGLSHLSHMACNLSFLLDKEYLKEHENQESHRWITDN